MPKPRLTAAQLSALEDLEYAKLAGGIGKAGTGAVAALPGMYDTYVTSRSKRTSKADVANQAAAGAGRWATAGLGAEAGAALGSLAGPFSMVTAPLGAMAGGAAGYFGGDKLIRAGRKFFGVEEADPIEGIKAKVDSGKRKLDRRAVGLENPPMYGRQGGYQRAVEAYHAANPNWRNLPYPNEEELDALNAATYHPEELGEKMARGGRVMKYAKGGGIERKGKTNTKMVKMASGGSVSSRADGIAKKGKTNCKYR